MYCTVTKICRYSWVSPSAVKINQRWSQMINQHFLSEIRQHRRLNWWEIICSLETKPQVHSLPVKEEFNSLWESFSSKQVLNVLKRLKIRNPSFFSISVSFVLFLHDESCYCRRKWCESSYNSVYAPLETNVYFFLKVSKHKVPSFWNTYFKYSYFFCIYSGNKINKVWDSHHI